MGQTDSGSKTTEQVVRLEKMDVDDTRRIFALKGVLTSVKGQVGLSHLVCTINSCPCPA